MVCSGALPGRASGSERPRQAAIHSRKAGGILFPLSSTEKEKPLGGTRDSDRGSCEGFPALVLEADALLREQEGVGAARLQRGWLGDAERASPSPATASLARRRAAGVSAAISSRIASVLVNTFSPSSRSP